MLEQQEQSFEAKKGADSEKMTQLEGIRSKVFMDRGGKGYCLRGAQ